jgi:hypothetical protein
MKSRKTSSPVTPSKSKWNSKNLVLHALHAAVLVVSIMAHPMRDHHGGRSAVLSCLHHLGTASPPP